MFKNYYSLTKSGLVYGNLIVVLGGFFVGVGFLYTGIDLALLFATVVGISLVMASGCVFNNCIDRDIDAKMPRTKNRALVAGKISLNSALTFGVILGLFGFLILGFFTNFLTLCIALFGFFAYVFLYSLLGKRRTVHGALIGSLSGATPPVIGYAAVTNHLDLGALILFAMLVIWQMPHFYAIAIRRADDYEKGGIPVLPVKKGITITKRTMFLYIVAFTIVAPLLTVFGYAGKIYFSLALILSLAWLTLSIKGFWINDTENNNRWVRQMFFLSLIVLTTLFIVLCFVGVARA